MDFLPAAIESSGLRMLPPFTENIVLTTLYRRSLSQKNKIRSVDNNEEVGSANLPRCQWLYQTVQKRLALLKPSPSSVELFDSMRLFTNILAHAVLIQLSEEMETQSVETNQQMLSTALDSACELVRLAKILTKTSLFKVSPASEARLDSGKEYMCKSS